MLAFILGFISLIAAIDLHRPPAFSRVRAHGALKSANPRIAISSVAMPHSLALTNFHDRTRKSYLSQIDF